ncbi:hypothetical protein CC80DRAFT_581016 [Byssothecium circinans]|uniref:CFEM domain-containing protein n=1 Tax=Byssothecium circinans TaxID=147558 RepID=A0A6A5U8J0_9PLEO|nr:hypothetical protein CC80DRAFT_581016 [Byssothecium circinans]
MKLTVFSLLAAATLGSAQRTYNITAALNPTQFKKYKCLTTEDWLPKIPECLHDCTIEANKADGCAYDDFACHCANYEQYSNALVNNEQIIEPCVLPPEVGGRGGGCNFQELSVAQPIVTDMCNFFNATVYADYVGCSWKLRLSPVTTLEIASREEIIVSA